MEFESVEPQEVNANIKYVTTPDSSRSPDDGKNKEYLNCFQTFWTKLLFELCQMFLWTYTHHVFAKLGVLNTNNPYI